jgi:hypothetical protein
MEDDLRYIDENGYTVLKSKFHRNRGRCCKSSCLHCPFGHTLKTVGLDIINISDSNQGVARNLFDKLFVTDDFTSNLLGSAFGEKKIVQFEPNSFKILYLKSVLVGLVQVNETNKVLKLKLLNHFDDQGISMEYVESLL